MIINYTGQQIQDLLDGQHTPFRQDIQDATYDVANKISVTGGTPVRLQIDGVNYNDKVAPSYMSGDGWDVVNDKIAFPNEINHPTYVADVGFVFDSGGGGGVVEISLWVDDTVPKKIRTYISDYTNTATTLNQIMTWYLGEGIGYDAKNDGVYIELNFDTNGSLWNMGGVFYRT